MDATSSAINKPKSFTRRTQTFTADFCNVSKRFLSETEHRLFRYRFLLGADEKLCCRQLKMDPGAFNHEVYRIQQKLGKAFAELEPYPLFPLADYFGHSHAGGVKPCVPVLVRRDAGPVRPPLAARVDTPARVSVMVAPAPVAPVIHLAEHVRARFRTGVSTRAIAADLTRLNVPAPNGAGRWGQADVRRLLLAA
ncbi:MAG TPA: hypothetical protein VHY84_01700 [Bryobacteraceae bacterium]|jgi:hypothetical protein|nr:hypothetical protein [Bryobacteraceae bacterium]